MNVVLAAERLVGPNPMVIQRVTGDPHPHELVAPDWSLQKRVTLDLIHRIFEEKGAWQGKRFRPPSAVLSDLSYRTTVGFRPSTQPATLTK